MSVKTHIQRKEDGLCTYCGVKPPRPGKNECDGCRRKRTKQSKKAYIHVCTGKNTLDGNDEDYCEITAWNALRKAVCNEDGWYRYIVGKEVKKTASKCDLNYQRMKSEVLSCLRSCGGEAFCRDICKTLHISWRLMMKLARKMIDDGSLDWKEVREKAGRPQMVLIAA